MLFGPNSLVNKMKLIYKTDHSTVEGDETTVTKTFTPTAMELVREGLMRSPKQEAKLQEELGKTILTPTVYSSNENSFTMQRLPYCMAGEPLTFNHLGKLTEIIHSIREQGYAHTDLKRQNIGADESQQEIYLFDWNGATKIGERQSMPQFTPGYSPPELEGNENVQETTDIYSFGMICLRTLGYKRRQFGSMPSFNDYIQYGTENWSNRKAYVDNLEQCLFFDHRKRMKSMHVFKELYEVLDEGHLTKYREQARVMSQKDTLRSPKSERFTFIFDQTNF